MKGEGKIVLLPPAFGNYHPPKNLMKIYDCARFPAKGSSQPSISAIVTYMGVLPIFLFQDNADEVIIGSGVLCWREFINHKIQR